jgi:hypothetical protein
MLATLSKREQRFEIEQSKSDIEAVIGKKISGFSFPHGSMNQDSASLLKESGYAYACNSADNNVSSRTNRFRLPRRVVNNWSGELFEKKLRQWMSLA